jgi:hypothetical protein
LKIHVQIVRRWNKADTIEEDVEPYTLAGLVKVNISRRCGLIPDDHLLQMIVNLPMPGSKELTFDNPSGKLTETGNPGLVRCPRTLREDQSLQQQNVSGTSELVLVWAPHVINRCMVCGVEMELFCRNYGFGGHWDLLLCPNCNRADWVSVGEHNRFSREWTAPILHHSGDIVIVTREENVELFELYGEPIRGERMHRHYTLSNPDLEILQTGTLLDRLIELLQTQISELKSFNYRTRPDRTLALHILRVQPNDSDSVCAELVASLAKHKELPGPGGSARALLWDMGKSLEVLNVLEFSIDSELRSRLRGLVMGLRNPDGGWTREIALVQDKNGEIEDPPGWRFRVVPKAESQVDPTRLALKSLHLLKTELDDKGRTVKFLRSCQEADGGFNGGRGCIRKSFLSSTFEAVEALDLLGCVPNDVEGVVSWLQGHQTADGGFANDATVMDWSSLIIGGKKEIIKPKVSLRSTFQAVKSLSILGSTPRHTQRCVQYVLSEQRRFGFGDASVTDSFHALSTLQMLGGLDKIQTLP